MSEHSGFVSEETDFKCCSGFYSEPVLIGREPIIVIRTSQAVADWQASAE